MAWQRISIVTFLGFLALAQLTTCSNSTNAHDLIVGTRVSGDHLIERAHVVEGHTFYRVNRVYRTFAGDGISKITQIRVLDQTVNGKGGMAAITSGGPDFNFVTLHIKSKRSHGIDLVVEVYGKQ